MEEEKTLEDMKNELLEVTTESPVEVKEPKRNTKQALISKILEISERDNIPLEFSNTRLKRMNKQQLADTLAGQIEKGMMQKMAQQVGCEQNANQQTIIIGALRMVHDLVVKGVECTGNYCLKNHGYEISGFSENLKEPQVSECVDACLMEIAQENQEILQYVESPYSRLLLAWAGALSFSCKRIQSTNVTFLEPSSNRRKNPIRNRSSGRQTPREIYSKPPPPTTDVKTV